MQSKFKLVHANAKNTGSAVDMIVRPATEQEVGYLMVSFAPQKTVAEISCGKRIMPTFNYERKIGVKLTIFEVAQIVGVLDGHQESLEDGKGLYHKSSKGVAVIGLTHKVESAVGYWFSVKRNPNESDEQKVGIFLSPVEGRTLSIILKQAMFYMGFGTPDTWPTAKELSANSEKKNVQ